MSEKSFREKIGFDTHLNIKGRYVVRGGIGHALYEVARSAKFSNSARAQATALSLKYYNYLCGFPNWSVGKAIDNELGAFVKAYPQFFVKKSHD
jgi:hypothetical protein